MHVKPIQSLSHGKSVTAIDPYRSGILKKREGEKSLGAQFMNSVSREENTLTCLRVFIYLCVKRETPQKTKHHLDLTSFLLSSLSSLCNIPPLICLFQISSVSLLIKW